MNKEDLGWAAGIIDGEGSIHARLTSKDIGTICLVMSVSSTTPAITTGMYSLLGGSCTGPYSYKGKSNRRPVYNWVIHGEDVKRTLRLLRPHLRAKVEQADVALDFALGSRGHHVTEEEQERRVRSYLELRKLNRRGGE